jgi:hypothetical protein
MACLGAKTTRQGDMVWGKRMSAHGVSFLEEWINNNVPAAGPHVNAWLKARRLGEKLRADAASAGVKLAELELAVGEVEKCIFDSMVTLSAPGTPGD